MIFPYLKGFLSYTKAPVTWALLVINILVFLVFNFVDGRVERQIHELTLRDSFLIAQGRYYSQFVQARSPNYDDLTVQLATQASGGDKEKLIVLGGFALKDSVFQKQRADFAFSGDEVEIQWWKEQATEIESLQNVHLSRLLGLSGDSWGAHKWITYQFAHSQFFHLVGNMIFLVLIGCLLETVIGSMSLLIVYLLSGMMAAGVFLLSTGFSSTPLIGASGSISGIATLFCFFYWKQPVRYIFFLFIPKRGYAGFIYLPGWVAFAMWMATDLAGYIGTLSEMGGVAYIAHLGGEGAGALIALMILGLRSITGEKLIPKESKFTQPTWTIQT